jgi:hypothetical protein
MRRVRRGELVALIGAVGLRVLMFLPWFALASHSGRRVGWTAYAPSAEAMLHRTGWGALGWFMDLLLALLIVAGILVALTAAARRSPTLPVGVAIVTWTAGALTFFVLLFVLIDQPGLGLSLPNDAVDQQLPGYLGLACTFLIPLGAWIALNDDRVHAADSAYTPPPARPIPEA